MKPATLLLSISLGTLPLAALSQVPGTPDAAPPVAGDEGTSMMEEGLKLMMRGLMTEMEPALEDMQGMLGELGEVTGQLGPELQAILTMMGDVRHYELPERMPNGDILIRRKLGAPPPPSLDPPATVGPPTPAPEIEL